MNRIVKTDLFNILDLINCVETYGFGDDVFYSSMFDLIRPVGNIEIRDYASRYMTPELLSQGYTDEDYDAAILNLTTLRDRYEI